MTDTLLDEDEPVCFGMLKNIPITLVLPWDGQNVEIAPWDSRGGDVVLTCLELAFAQEYCDIQTQSKATIARLNKRTFRVLALLNLSLNLAEKIRYRALLPLAELRRRLDLASQTFTFDSSQASWSMSILISGPRSISRSLAKGLSRHRLYLQHPSTIPDDMSYENPQYLIMVGSSFSNGAVLAPIALEANQDANDAAETKAAHPRSEGLDDNVVDVITMLDLLSSHDYLAEPKVDGRIETVLLPHQKAGVDYIVGRESTKTLKERQHSLWQLESHILQDPVYRHVISGTKSPTPTDILGGILADDMGLGKTLTMIATIVTTLPQAEEHTTAKPPPIQHYPKPLIPVKSTLVIVPSTLLLDGWIDEIKKHVTPATLSYCKYHGPGRMLSDAAPLPHHIILTTYGTVTADLRRGGGVLECFHWYRIILDEGGRLTIEPVRAAHVIRNSATKQFEAVARLVSTIRWCMTGTPIQNSLFDLGSLVKFLRVPLLEDSTVFRKHIIGKRTQGIFMRKQDAVNLKLLVSSLCLRRNSLILPFLEPISVQHRPELSPLERRAYSTLAQSCKRAIDAVVSNKRTKRGNNTILTALLKLRIFCNNGLVSISEMMGDAETIVPKLNSDEIISLLQQSGDATCVSCGADMDSFDRIGARDLTKQTAFDRLRLKCQDCTRETKAAASAPADQPGPDSGAGGERLTYPSKLTALLADMQEHQSQDKSIVFSFWKRSLKLVAQLLNEHGIESIRVDGDLSPKQRKEALADFCNKPDARVLLMTLGTGAVGLNDLSVASRVHILEPQWNPSTESQAIGRVLRLGQEKRVTIVRYIVKTSIEESVESRQMMKVQLALKGGLHSEDPAISEGQQRTSRLQELSKMIQATILPDDPVSEEPRGRKRPRDALESDAEMDWVPN